MRERYGPRFWPIWFGIGVLRLIALLPFSVQIQLGKLLGQSLYFFARQRRAIATTNINSCFPELSLPARKALVKQTMIENGIGFIETGIAWWSRKLIKRDKVRIEGANYLVDAKAQGNGVILVGAHYSMLDLGGVLLSFVDEFDVMYRENKNPIFNHIMLKARGAFCNNTIERSDMRRVVRCLKAGNIVWYAPDQDYGPRGSVFVPFFGVDAATTTATARLAKINNSPILILGYLRNANNDGYSLSISPPLVGFPSGDDLADARAINSRLEQEIRKAPAQYMWVHRRFKTRPVGTEGFYR